VPTYQYACTACGHELEAVQSFSDDALTTCPDCGGNLRKLFGNVGVVFKGSGFYRNDARTSASESSSSSGSGDAAAKKTDSSTSSTPASSTSTSTTSSSSSNSSTSGTTS
jgi:putative FmdB family regulatory protein